MEIVRVLRIVEYVGSRERVEETVRRSLHGDKVMKDLTIRCICKLMSAIHRLPFKWIPRRPGFAADQLPILRKIDCAPQCK